MISAFEAIMVSLRLWLGYVRLLIKTVEAGKFIEHFVLLY